MQGIWEDSLILAHWSLRFDWRIKGRHPERQMKGPTSGSLAGGLVPNGPAWPDPSM